MSGCEPPDQAFGFLLTISAGLATVLGCAFIPALKWGNQDRVTSGALGFAAGVMLYVSFVDVLGEEATNYFRNHYTGNGCFDEGQDHGHEHGHGHGPEAHEARRLHGSDAPVQVRIWVAVFFFFGIFVSSMMDHVMALIPGMGHSHGADSARDLEIQLNTRNADGTEQSQPAPKPGASETDNAPTRANGDGSTGGAGHEGHSNSSSLERVSMVAFLALTLHNVPEGLATFLGASRGSMTVPFAIAMHNIPEGAAIAIPGYQVHGSVGKALRSTFIAGLAQPVGALIGWFIIIVLQMERLPEFFYGATYSATAGIMVGVSILELIPEALQSAPARFVGMSVFAGFLVMELSIVLLNYADAN